MSKNEITCTNCGKRMAAMTREQIALVGSHECNADDPPILYFPTVGKAAGNWGLSVDFFAELQNAFPHRDILRDVQQARGWLVANPRRRKTHRGMTRFLFGWIEQNQNRGRGTGSERTTAADELRRVNEAVTARGPVSIDDGTWSGLINWLPYVMGDGPRLVEYGKRVLDAEREGVKFEDFEPSFKREVVKAVKG